MTPLSHRNYLHPAAGLGGGTSSSPISEGMMMPPPPRLPLRYRQVPSAHSSPRSSAQWGHAQGQTHTAGYSHGSRPTSSHGSSGHTGHSLSGSSAALHPNTLSPPLYIRRPSDEHRRQSRHTRDQFGRDARSSTTSVGTGSHDRRQDDLDRGRIREAEQRSGRIERKRDSSRPASSYDTRLVEPPSKPRARRERSRSRPRKLHSDEPSRKRSSVYGSHPHHEMEIVDPPVAPVRQTPTSARESSVAEVSATSRRHPPSYDYSEGSKSAEATRGQSEPVLYRRRRYLALMGADLLTLKTSSSDARRAAERSNELIREARELADSQSEEYMVSVLSRSKLETNAARMTSVIKAFASRISERPSRAESDAHSNMTKKLEGTRRLLNLVGESAKEAEEHMDVTRYVVYKSGGKEFSSVIDSVQDIRVDMRRWKGTDETERTLESVLDSMYELKASSALWAPQLAILGYIEQKMEDAMEELTKARKSLGDVDTRELAMEETLAKLQNDDEGE